MSILTYLRNLRRHIYKTKAERVCERIADALRNIQRRSCLGDDAYSYVSAMLDALENGSFASIEHLGRCGKLVFADLNECKLVFLKQYDPQVQPSAVSKSRPFWPSSRAVPTPPPAAQAQRSPDVDVPAPVTWWPEIRTDVFTSTPSPEFRSGGGGDFGGGGASASWAVSDPSPSSSSSSCDSSSSYDSSSSDSSSCSSD